MTSARYQGINARINGIHKAFPEHATKAGWETKKGNSFPNNAMFERQVFSDKATDSAKIANDLTLDVDSQEELIDIAETASAQTLGLQEIKSRYTATSKFNITVYPAAEPELIYSPWCLLEYNAGGKAYSVAVDKYRGCAVAG